MLAVLFPVLRLSSIILMYVRPSFTVHKNGFIKLGLMFGSATAMLVSVATGRAQQFGGSSESSEGTWSVSNSLIPWNRPENVDLSNSSMRWFGCLLFPVCIQWSIASQFFSVINSISSSSPSRCKTKQLRFAILLGSESDPESLFEMLSVGMKFLNFLQMLKQNKILLTRFWVQ